MKIRIDIAWTLCVLIFIVENTFILAEAAQEITHTFQTELKTTGEGNLIVSGGGQEKVATFTFVSAEIGFEALVIKGVPFIADTVTEFLRTLGNGQKIYRKSTALLARDSEGRTRREQTIGAIGPYTGSGHAHQSIFINDPVAGVSYTLQPHTKTATKTIVVLNTDKGKSSDGTVSVTTSIETSHVERDKHGTLAEVSEDSKRNVVVVESTLHSVSEGATDTYAKSASLSNVRTDSLGSKTFDGIAAEGTRTVETIPAGSMGNDTPIEVVSERWYSPELGVVVKSVRNDPLTGDNVYQLSNIRRIEPDPSLFQIPSLYTVKETNMKVTTTKK